MSPENQIYIRVIRVSRHPREGNGLKHVFIHRLQGEFRRIETVSTEHTGDLYPVYALFLSPNGSRHPGDFINLCRVELTDFHKLRFNEW